MKSSSAISADAPPVAGRGYYIYAVTGKRKSRPADLEVITRDGLYAWVSQVEAEEFSPARLEGDSSWLRDKATLHDQVIKSIGTRAVIPMRFATVVRSRDDVLHLLETHRETFGQLLADLEGKQEWGLKIRLQETVPAPSAAATVSSGTEYLRHKKESQEAQRRLEKTRSAAVRDCHAALSTQADRAVVLPANALDPSGDLLLKAAYLVADESFEDFESTVGALSERHASQGLRLVLSGPWPPYSFVNVQLSVGKEATR